MTGPGRASTPGVDPAIVLRLRVASAALAAMSLGVGLVVLAGWFTGHLVLASFHPRLVTMRPNSAVGTMLVAAAVLLLTLRKGGRTASALGAAAALAGAATLAEIATGRDLGIDRVVLALPGFAPFSGGVLMSPHAAIALLVLGASVALLGAGTRRIVVAQALAALAALVTLLAVVGYLYGAPDLFQVASLVPISLPSAVALSLVSASLLFASAERGPAAILASRRSGGVIVRRVLPLAIAAPVLSDLALRLSMEAGANKEAIHAVVVVALLGSVVLYTGWRMDAFAAARDAAHEEVARSEARTRALNVELTRQAAELSAANRELEAFGHSVSHDLRAPLRAVVGLSQALMEDHGSKLGEDGQDLLRRIQGGARRMSALIDDLLALSHVTRAEVRREPVDLSRIASAVVDELARSDPRRAVAAEVEAGLVAAGDPALLRIALENLLGNAWKFTSRRDRARIRFGRTRRDGEEAFFVSDDGAGFDMAHAGRLFGAFRRLHSEAEFPGTGVGLATVQRVVRRHGGRVWGEGEVDRGATFYFTLPPEEP